MKKLLYFVALSLVIVSCSKATVEPDPTDQVVGTYTTTNYTATTNGAGFALDLTNTSVGLQITFDIVKKTANTATMIEKDVNKDATGKITTDTYTYDIDLKKNAKITTQYDITDSKTGASRGSVGNDSMTFLNEYDDKDSNGKAIKVKETFIAKKQ
jgi:hypothetical protein